MFAYHVLTDVSGARDVNNIRCSQMRLLPLLLMERIRNWLNLFLKHFTVEAIWEGSAGFHTHAPLCFSYSILTCSTLLSISISISVFPSFRHPVASLMFLTLSPTLSSCLPPSSHSPCLSLSVSHLRVIIFRSRIWWKWIGSEGC